MSKIAATGSILPKALLVICAMLKDREPSKCDGNEWPRKAYPKSGTCGTCLHVAKNQPLKHIFDCFGLHRSDMRCSNAGVCCSKRKPKCGQKKSHGLGFVDKTQFEWVLSIRFCDQPGNERVERPTKNLNFWDSPSHLYTCHAIIYSPTRQCVK